MVEVESAKAAFVPEEEKWISNRLPFGLASSLSIFSRLLALTFAQLGSRGGLLVYVGAWIVCSSMWESYLSLLEDMF